MRQSLKRDMTIWGNANLITSFLTAYEHISAKMPERLLR